MSVQFFDTHCHIQSIGAGNHPLANKWQNGGVTNVNEVITSAKTAGVSQMIAVGTDVTDSQLAVNLASKEASCWASVGIHPHEAKIHHDDQENLQIIRKLCDEDSVVAVGEIGLDYFYEHSDRNLQVAMLESLLAIAQEKKLPVIFHVREAHDDFWPILDNFPRLRGVLHSFSADKIQVQEALMRNLYIGLNGIMTFTKQQDQLDVVKMIPKENLLLETDAPFLTPTPHRGKICKPEHVVVTGKFLADLREESVENLADYTTRNAHNLFLKPTK